MDGSDKHQTLVFASRLNAEQNRGVFSPKPNHVLLLLALVGASQNVNSRHRRISNA